MTLDRWYRPLTRAAPTITPAAGRCVKSLQYHDNSKMLHPRQVVFSPLTAVHNFFCTSCLTAFITLHICAPLPPVQMPPHAPFHSDHLHLSASNCPFLFLGLCSDPRQRGVPQGMVVIYSRPSSQSVSMTSAA